MNTIEKAAANDQQPLPDAGTRAPGKGKKPVSLKQFFVSGTVEPGSGTGGKGAFILHTCAVNARREFEERTGASAGSCCVAAESDLTKDDMPKHDFWKERRNWIEEMPAPAETESGRMYFETKARAEKVQAAKRAAGITEWDLATERQLAKVSELLGEKKA